MNCRIKAESMAIRKIVAKILVKLCWNDGTLKKACSKSLGTMWGYLFEPKDLLCLDDEKGTF